METIVPAFPKMYLSSNTLSLCVKYHFHVKNLQIMFLYLDFQMVSARQGGPD